MSVGESHGLGLESPVVKKRKEMGGAAFGQDEDLFPIRELLRGLEGKDEGLRRLQPTQVER